MKSLKRWLSKLEINPDLGKTITHFNPTDRSHRRLNPFSGEWVLVSPHRAKQLWQGQPETPDQPQLPRYESECCLSVGNTRINGGKYPPYQDILVFPNDFAAPREDTSPFNNDDALFTVVSEQRHACVVCFSPDNSKTWSELNCDAISKVLDCWVEQIKQIGETYPWLQIFENKGAMVGY